MKVRKIGKRWKVTVYTLTYWVKQGGGDWRFVTRSISRMDRSPPTRIHEIIGAAHVGAISAQAT